MELKRKDFSLTPAYEKALYNLMNEYIIKSQDAKYLPLILDMYVSTMIKEEQLEDITIIEEISITEEMLKSCKSLFSNTISFLFDTIPDFISPFL